MREIKFRAWDKKRKMMLYIGSFSCIYLSGKIDGIINRSRERMSIYDIELMQYTGLKDKNGKEIWEGDVVTWDMLDKAQVIFGTPCIEDNEAYSDNQIAGFYLKHIGLNKYDTHMDDIEQVIGNIYENPELLSQTQSKGGRK